MIDLFIHNHDVKSTCSEIRCLQVSISILCNIKRIKTEHVGGITEVLVLLGFLFHSIPKLKPARDLKKPETMSTTLPCGLTVATRETYETVELCLECIIIGEFNWYICWFRKCR